MTEAPTKAEDPLGRLVSNVHHQRPDGSGIRREHTLNRGELQAVAFLHEEALVKQWIAEVLDISIEGHFSAFLADGTVLCKLMNKIKPNSISKIHKAGSPAYLLMENINFFLTLCLEMGIDRTEIFTPIDLFEKKNFPQVIRCLLRVGGNATRAGFKPPLQRPNSLQEVTFTDEEVELANELVSVVVPPPPPPPKPQYAVVDPNDSLDVCLGDFINVRMEKELPPSVTVPMPIERVSQGQYRFANKVILMKEVNGHIVVRVGGGWMAFKEFLVRYNSIVGEYYPKENTGPWTKAKLEKQESGDGTMYPRRQLSEDLKNALQNPDIMKTLRPRPHKARNIPQDLKSELLSTGVSKLKHTPSAQQATDSNTAATESPSKPTEPNAKKPPATTPKTPSKQNVTIASPSVSRRNAPTTSPASSPKLDAKPAVPRQISKLALNKNSDTTQPAPQSPKPASARKTAATAPSTTPQSPKPAVPKQKSSTSDMVASPKVPVRKPATAPQSPKPAPKPTRSTPAQQTIPSPVLKSSTPKPTVPKLASTPSEGTTQTATERKPSIPRQNSKPVVNKPTPPDATDSPQRKPAIPKTPTTPKPTSTESPKSARKPEAKATKPTTPKQAAPNRKPAIPQQKSVKKLAPTAKPDDNGQGE